VAPSPETFTFTPDAPDVVVARMDRLGAAHDGWINLLPLIREEDQPPPATGFGTLFSGSVHQVPVCTWAAGTVGRRGIEPDSVGIQHATGTKVVARLVTLGHPVPEGWRWVQDHPRRGLVLRVPVGTAHAEQLTRLLEAGTVLSLVPVTGEWEARVRVGRGR
jgi:hypothetical protein